MREERSGNNYQEIVGDSPALKRMLKSTTKVAPIEAPVLIFGEGGSGKELLARTIHRMSPRRHESFVQVNCATTSGGMLESELFGQVKESTGKSQKVGRIELANKGILFLDEVADIPQDIQVKLLRLLKRGEFALPGSTDDVGVNVRLIAATRHDLAKRVASQMFLGDLYGLLKALHIRVPPLRERREDIPLLAHHFMQIFARRLGKHVETIPAETLSTLVNFDWPGNVRQLENLIEQSVISTEGPALRVPQNWP